MNPVRAAALTWLAYKKWECGDPQIRAHYMKVSMKDMLLAATSYRVKRKGEIMRPCLNCGALWPIMALNEYQICSICEEKETPEEAYARYEGLKNHQAFLRWQMVKR